MLDRLWTYQKERFPLAPLSVLAFTLGLSATGFSSLLRGEGTPSAAIVMLAAAAALLFWMQMRVLDEFKDAEDDARFRPYRPVPRGLVTFGELRAVLLVAAVGEVLIAMAIDARLLWLLAAVWAFLALMTAEFFAADWLRARPGLYMASHCPIGFLICFYLSAFDWLPAEAPVDGALALNAVANLFAMMLLEVGRKIRAPADEERGVVTYSAAWGRGGAAGAWLAMGAGLVVAGGMAAIRIGAGAAFGALVAAFALGAAIVAGRFLRRPQAQRARWIEAMSVLATLALHVGLSPVPLLLAR